MADEQVTLTRKTIPYEYLVRFHPDGTVDYHFQELKLLVDGDGNTVAIEGTETIPIDKTPENVANYAGKALAEMAQRYDKLAIDVDEYKTRTDTNIEAVVTENEAFAAEMVKLTGEKAQLMTALAQANELIAKLEAGDGAGDTKAGQEVGEAVPAQEGATA